MALVNRVSRLFKADFHAVLDRIEEPDVLLRQAIREMQDDLAEDEHRLKEFQYEQQQHERRKSDLQHSLEKIGGELDVCFDAGKEDLAYKLVRRNLEEQQRLKHVNKLQQNGQQQIEDIMKRIVSNRQQLEGMQQKAECLLDEVGKVQGATGWYDVSDVGVQDCDVEVAFLQEKQRRAS